MNKRIPAYEGKEPYIFVSYAHRDGDIVLPIIDSLYNNKYRVWYDEGIAPGSEWPHNIAAHIEKADSVIVFTSENSLASINCENEVVRAKELNKNIIVYNINKKHDLLKEYINVEDKEKLLNSLDERLIGDGITGYERQNEKGKRSYLWNIVLGLSVILMMALGTCIYGLNSGWFDEYLPGRKIVEIHTEEPDVESADTINSSVLAQAILSQLGKDELMKEVEFNNEEDFIKYCEIFGYNYVDHHITYFDLTNDHRQEIYIDYAKQGYLELLKYYPSLEKIIIDGGEINSIEILNECPYLKTVDISFDILPVTLPDDMRFELIVK